MINKHLSVSATVTQQRRSKHNPVDLLSLSYISCDRLKIKQQYGATNKTVLLDSL